jgi:hypothetical protein
MRFSFNFLGRVQGVYVLGLAALIALVLLAFAPASERLLLSGFGIILVMVLAVGWRVVRGGDQGTTDLEVTPGALKMSNIPLVVATSVLQRALGVYLEQQHLPIPKPVGTVHGSPANLANVEEDKQAALPPHTPVADEPLEIPEDARGLSVNVHDDRSVADDTQPQKEDQQRPGAEPPENKKVEP